MMWRFVGWLILGLLTATLGLAQSSIQGRVQLGMQYYQQSDYARATEVFEGVLKDDPSNNTAYTYLFNGYVQLEQYEQAEKLAAQMAKRDRTEAMYEVDQAFALRKQGKESKALQQYDGLIKKLTANRGQLMMLANAFRMRGEFDYAIKVYQRARQLLGEPSSFALELADLFLATGQKSAMIDAYLDYLHAAPHQLNYVQNMLQSRLADEDYSLLRSVLLDGIQKRPDDLMLSELMIWFFVQQKDFEGAFVQARAMDRRLNENGSRILMLARSARENRAFAAAIDFYAYLIEKGPVHANYYEARFEVLEARQELLTERRADEVAWQSLAIGYETYIKEFPAQRNITLVKKGLARILAYELKQFEEAIALLETNIRAGGDRRLQAAVKLDLGDLYLLTDELWEAALTYGQVEKDFPNDPLGQEAKFRNARLSFYKGEFEWSQAQLDVLKASTSQRIANDALALSLLITDNLDLDTTVLPMQAFARAELLMFRQEYDSAHEAFEQVTVAYPGHGLTDEIWYRQARMFERQGKYEDAAARYEKILKQFEQDILGDDALFALAVLYAEKLNDRQKAMQLFQDLLIKYPDSTFTFEARRRFRALRGDKIN